MKKFFLVYIIFLIYLISNPVPIINDSRYTIHTSLSLIHQGNLDLDEYKSLIKHEKEWEYTIRTVNHHIYSIYPNGTVFFITPVIFLLDKFGVILKESNLVLNNVDRIEVLLASFISALSALPIYLISRERLRRWQSLLVVLIFSFGTSMWSTASKALWQHDLSVLILSWSLHLLTTKKNINDRYMYLGMLLGFSINTRPTNIVPAVLLSIYIITSVDRRDKFLYMFSFLVPVLFLIFTSILAYGTLLPLYYEPSFNNVGTSLSFQTLAGNMISPNRGLFVFSPILIFSFFGIYKTIKNKDKFSMICIFVLICHFILISSYPQWWGGWSIGPRLWTDMMPFFIYFIILLLSNKARHYPLFVIFFFAFTVLSVIIHGKCSASTNAMLWNDVSGSHKSIDDDPTRIWDYNDWQVLR